jgi:23S rRNA (adenine2503-C2)-methyltransferase
MGMGEPLLNYENTMAAVNHIISSSGLGMSPQRITLSTAGIVSGIMRMADDDVKINLSISLHTANNQKRSELMPINQKYNLNSLKDALKYYHTKTGRRITYEYLLLGNVNDSLQDASALTEFTKISPCKINLIEYNPHENDSFNSPEKERTNLFVAFLESKNLVVTLRKSKGQDINAACGQLANKKQ